MFFNRNRPGKPKYVIGVFKLPSQRLLHSTNLTLSEKHFRKYATQVDVKPKKVKRWSNSSISVTRSNFFAIEQKHTEQKIHWETAPPKNPPKYSIFSSFPQFLISDFLMLFFDYKKLPIQKIKFLWITTHKNVSEILKCYTKQKFQIFHYKTCYKQGRVTAPIFPLLGFYIFRKSERCWHL